METFINSLKKSTFQIPKGNRKESAKKQVGRYTRLSNKDQVFFVKRLSFLIKAGIPVLESLQMIQEQTRGKSQKKALQAIIDDVSSGQRLSGSLSKYKRMFGEFSVNIIGFGEETGILSENLEYLADELKKRQALKKKIIGAFIYPAIVTAATFAITGFLMIYLFPKITPIFSSIHMDLPLTTRIVMALSDFLRHDGLLSLGILALVIITGFVVLKKNKTIHYHFDRQLLRIPIVGQIMQYYNLANSTRTMGLLLKSGITISEALPIAGKTTINLVYKKEFANLSEMVSRGEKMSTYLKSKRNLFPDVLSQIVSVGERSGNLSSSLIYLSNMYEAEMEDFTKNLSNVIEPILMIVMGVMVGFIAISIITPIYGITQHLQAK